MSMTADAYTTRLRNMAESYFGRALNGDVVVRHDDRAHTREHLFEVTLEVVAPKGVTSMTERTESFRSGLEGTPWAVIAQAPVRRVGRDCRTGRYARVFLLVVAVFVDYDGLATT